MGVRPDFQGDYMGFTYNEKHSSELGIVRVSDGSRFNENLLPTMQDKTVQVPGGDGMYYFGSYYTQRQFNVNFAFDSLSEEQIAELKRHFGDKQIHDLIFDETPYKVWGAKVTGTATLKYIPFGEGETGRTYKGEGTIQFTCYNPFARCKSKNILDYVVEKDLSEDDYEKNKYYVYDEDSHLFVLSTDDFDGEEKYYSNTGNINEWIVASGIGKINSPSYIDLGGDKEGFEVYNPGVKDSDFLLALTSSVGGSISIGAESLDWEDITLKEGEEGIVINSKLKLIQGIVFDNSLPLGYRTTKNIYNEHIVSGEFFKIPLASFAEKKLLAVNNDEMSGRVFLHYDYWYL